MANLQQRYWELRNNVGNLPQTRPATPDPRYGYRSVEGEQHQFEGRQIGLRNRLNDWNSNNCGPPPAEAWDWAVREVPSPDPKPSIDPSQLAKTAAGGAVAIGTGYVVYRIIRFLPSLLPPLWWTIPENAVIP